VLSKKRQHLHSLAHVVVPYLVPIVAVAVGAVALGHDLGTVLILGAIVAGVLFAAGVPLRWFAFAGVPFVAWRSLWFVLSSANRLSRFDVWLGRDTDEFGTARQPIHGRYALADGGWLGVGLGRAARSGGCSPSRTTTSSSRSSAKSSACPARSGCWPCSRRSRLPATGWSRAPTTSSSASRRPGS
jgi:cell division protein FtsW (lipid II flippase)